MRFLFTDIDGVFNSSRSRGRRRVDGILHDAVTRFDDALLGLDAHAIVTSEWRNYTSLDDTCKILGTTQRARFAGMLSPGMKGSKSAAIDAWLLSHVPREGTTPIEWAILDDNPQLFTLAHRVRLITTNPAVGLTDADLDELIALFTSSTL